jgi:tetratricopeptide (TPR) repeat protein
MLKSLDKIPFDIPESLNSYLITSMESPEKGIANLEKYVAKRRSDAIGYFLLAILYHRNDERDKAKRAASNARSLAPGSELMGNLHYFLSHPKGFDAWTPKTSRSYTGKHSENGTNNTISLDLETLISRLTRATQKRIKIVDESSTPVFNEKAEGVEQLATPTLALIFEKQGKYDEALTIYRKLLKSRPMDAEQYQAQIERLEQLV